MLRGAITKMLGEKNAKILLELARGRKAEQKEAPEFEFEEQDDEKEYHSNFPNLDPYFPYFLGKPMLYNFTRNLFGGLTIALVNVPLSIALAIASSCPPIYGVVTAFWAGFFAAICGGSQFNVVGPTGALSGLLSSYALTYGPEALPWLAITTGILCMIFFILSLDTYVMFLPGSVIHGFTLGVAVIIAGGQIGNAFGLRGLHSHTEFRNNLLEQITHLGSSDFGSFALFFCCWLALYLLGKRFDKIPWGVVVASFGVFIGYSTYGKSRLVTLKEKYGELEPYMFTAPSSFSGDFDALITNSLGVAFVAILETLISGKIADGLTKTTMNQRREVFGIAMANLASGLAGGLPATAALARTALNIRSGGHSRVSIVLNALFTLIIVSTLLPIFSYLPLPVVASLLFQVAIGMIEVKHIKQMWKMDKLAFVLTLVIAMLCIIIDPTTGIVFGAIFGMLRFADRISIGSGELIIRKADDIVLHIQGEKLDFTKSSDLESEGLLSLHRLDKIFEEPKKESFTLAALVEEPEKAILIYRIIGALTYVNVGTHVTRIRRITQGGKYFILSFQFSDSVDVDAIEGLEEIEHGLKHNRKKLIICDLLSSVYPIFLKSDWFRAKREKGIVFATLNDALRFCYDDQHAVHAGPSLVSAHSHRGGVGGGVVGEGESNIVIHQQQGQQ